MKKESETEYRVVFFGDFTYAMLNIKKIRPFASTPRKFDKKNHKLSLAIKSALRVMKKESTIKRETEAVLKPVKVAKKSKKEAKSRKIRKVEKKKVKRAVHKKPKVKKVKSSALELINDTQLDELGDKSENGGNKMSLSLAIEGTKEEVYTGVAKSERGNGDKSYFDEMIETKSMKPTGAPTKFGLETSKGHNFGNDQSAIALMNQTKNSLRSLENVQDMLLQKEVLNLKNESNILEKESIGSKCPSIIEFKMKDLDQSLNENMQFAKFLEKEEKPKTDFGKVEKEMQELVNVMKTTQSIGQLEERLKQWHVELETKANFKSIVETNIGKHLTNMRSFCNKRLNETIHYNNVLNKIRDFENIIIEKISKTFFGCEEMHNQSKDLLSLMQNKSPASKDLTIKNHSFPSPKFDKQYILGSGFNIRTRRRRSNIRQALLKTHQEPNKIRKMTEMIYLENYQEKQMSKSFMNSTFDNSKMDLKDKIGEDMGLEDQSVLTMKKETDNEMVWNMENDIDKDTQRKVVNKFSKRMAKINTIPRLKEEVCDSLGSIMEETIRKSCKGKKCYQIQVLKVLKRIEESGHDFYNVYLKHEQGLCDVRKLKVLIRQNLQCN